MPLERNITGIETMELSQRPKKFPSQSQNIALPSRTPARLYRRIIRLPHCVDQ